jgi:hypothetical protein
MIKDVIPTIPVYFRRIFLLFNLLCWTRYTALYFGWLNHQKENPLVRYLSTPVGTSHNIYKRFKDSFLGKSVENAQHIRMDMQFETF